MYNENVNVLLDSVSELDGIIDSSQQCFVVKDSFSIIELYLGERVSFRVFGDVYTLVLSKWLQQRLQAQEDIQNVSLQQLIEYLDIPEVKIRSAVQIIELIEKIYAK